MIVRTHVAFGGGPIVFVGHDQPWDFKKKSQAFSRRLEKLRELVLLRSDDELFQWCEDKAFQPVAIEIARDANMLPGHAFPARSALIVGNERDGLSTAVLNRCSQVVTVPQFGEVECLNVAMACGIVIYEFSKGRSDLSSVDGAKFAWRAKAGCR